MYQGGEAVIFIDHEFYVVFPVKPELVQRVQQLVGGGGEIQEHLAAAVRSVLLDRV